jgi:hypothetical protein
VGAATTIGAAPRDATAQQSRTPGDANDKPRHLEQTSSGNLPVSQTPSPIRTSCGLSLRDGAYRDRTGDLRRPSAASAVARPHPVGGPSQEV